MSKPKLISFALVVSFIAACQPGGRAPTPKTEDEKTLYALGLLVGKNLHVFNLTSSELELVKAGMTDEVLNRKPAVAPEAYGPKVSALARARTQAHVEQEKAKGTAVLDAAAKESGAEKLPSGLVYKSEKEGTGDSPAKTDTVKVNYEGTLGDGTVFDSSKTRGQPAEFPLNGVIPCWTEGVGKMKIGGKAKLTCPSAIAYGDQGRQPKIPGGATLTFEVELLEIKKTPTPPPGLSPPGLSQPFGAHPTPLPPGARPVLPMNHPAMTPPATPPKPATKPTTN